MTARTLEGIEGVNDIAQMIREYLSQESRDDGPVVAPCVLRMMPERAESLLRFIAIAQEQRAEIEELKAHRERLEECW